jgi:hypothetical protein
MHQSNTLSMSMDVHKDALAVASIATKYDAEVISLTQK